MKEDLGNPQEDIQYMIEPPRDLHELYMRLRAQLSSSKSFHSYYMKLISIVKVGSKLLPTTKDCTRISNDIKEYLSSPEAYPGKRQMERIGDMYQMGNDSTGLICVNQHDIEIGLNEALEQQMTHLLPKLNRLDSDTMDALIEHGIIEKKRPILEDLLIDQTMSELSSMIQSRTSERQ